MGRDNLETPDVVGPQGSSGAQRGRGWQWSEAGLLAPGFTYGGSKRIEPGARRVLVSRLQGDDPARSVQISVKVTSLDPNSVPRARVWVKYGTGSTLDTIELVGAQALTLSASTVEIYAETEGSSSIPVQVDTFVAYGSASVRHGARWRSPVFTLPSLGNITIDAVDGFEGALFSTSAGNPLTLEQVIDSTLPVTVRQAVQRGEPFKIVPGVIRYVVTSSDAFDQGVLLSVEAIP